MIRKCLRTKCEVYFEQKRGGNIYCSTFCKGKHYRERKANEECAVAVAKKKEIDPYFLVRGAITYNYGIRNTRSME